MCTLWRRVAWVKLDLGAGPHARNELESGNSDAQSRSPICIEAILVLPAVSVPWGLAADQPHTCRGFCAALTPCSVGRGSNRNTHHKHLRHAGLASRRFAICWKPACESALRKAGSQRACTPHCLLSAFRNILCAVRLGTTETQALADCLQGLDRSVVSSINVDSSTRHHA